MKDIGDEIKVLDTRMIAHVPIRHIKGAEADVLRACRNTMRERAVFERLSGRYPAEAIRTALNWLEEENIVLHIGDEYLALPVDRAGSTGEK